MEFASLVPGLVPAAVYESGRRHELSLLVVLASPLLHVLAFDFNRSMPGSETAPSVATFLELRKDPQQVQMLIEIVAPNSGAAEGDRATPLRRFRKSPNDDAEQFARARSQEEN